MEFSAQRFNIFSLPSLSALLALRAPRALWAREIESRHYPDAHVAKFCRLTPADGRLKVEGSFWTDFMHKAAHLPDP